jgi:chromosome segregation ATPase
MRRVSLLSRENEQERLRLADCLRHVVHSHKSTLAVAERKYALLESKLGEYRGLFDRQREEIEALRSALRRLSAGATEAEVQQMRALVERLARALQQARQEARDRALARRSRGAARRSRPRERRPMPRAP